MCISFQEILYLLNNKQTFQADSVLFKPVYIVYGCPKSNIYKVNTLASILWRGCSVLKRDFLVTHLLYSICSKHPYS